MFCKSLLVVTLNMNGQRYHEGCGNSLIGPIRAEGGSGNQDPFPYPSSGRAPVRTPGPFRGPERSGRRGAVVGHCVLLAMLPFRHKSTSVAQDELLEGVVENPSALADSRPKDQPITEIVL